MALKYKLLKQKASVGKFKGQQVYVAQRVSSGRIDFDQFCDMIAEESAMTSADVKAIMDRMNHIFERFLFDGYTIDCGELGTFYPTYGSTYVEKEEDFHVHKHMKKGSFALSCQEKVSQL